MRTTRRFGTIGAIVLAAVVAGGCGESIEDAERALCADLATLQSSIATLSALDEDATLEEFEQARHEVRDAWRDAKAAGDNLGDDRFDEVEDAWEDFADDIMDVDDQDEVRDAVRSIAAASDDREAAQAKLRAGIDCAAGNGDTVVEES